MHIPTEIKLLQKPRVLHVTYDDGNHFELSCEYLRVFSPSAEVRGHGQHEPNLIHGKKNVNIVGIDPIGNYAIKLVFDDGHSTGIYSWSYLYQLGIDSQINWQTYLERLEKAGKTREE